MTPAVTPAEPGDADEVASIHLLSRARAMPWLRVVHTEAETRDHFARVVGQPPGSWWVVRDAAGVAAYLWTEPGTLHDLYVHPDRQGRGLGTALLGHARTLSPDGLVLWAFQRNTKARAFYERHGFRSVRQTNGDNEEGEPDVLYGWHAAGLPSGAAPSDAGPT